MYIIFIQIIHDKLSANLLAQNKVVFTLIFPWLDNNKYRCQAEQIKNQPKSIYPDQYNDDIIHESY